MNKIRNILSKANYAYVSFLYFPIILILTSGIIRLYEFISIALFSTSTDSFFRYIVKGFLYDIPYSLLISLFYLPLFLLLFSISKKAVAIVSYIIIMIYALLDLCLIEYFRSMLIPLDEVVYSYTIDELKMIIQMSSTTNFWLLGSTIFITLFLIHISIPIIKSIAFLKSKVSLIFLSLLMILSLAFSSKTEPVKNRYEKEFYYNVTLNKLQFFINSTDDFIQKSNEFKNVDINKYIPAFQSDYPERNYISEQYPLIYENTYEDVLGNFFIHKEEKPNIVFIIMESLGKSISGKNASFLSLTPFLDSLSEHSLNWENFLSNTERTFGVLPNILGSLPFSKEGFAATLPEMPKHQSLLKILNNNGYYSSFYYGGWTYFNRMSLFLQRNNINFIMEEFDSTYVKMRELKPGFSWGYHDKDVFKHSFDYFNNSNGKPRLDIFLTLSTHSPWDAPNYEYYKKEFLLYLKKIGIKEGSEKFKIIQRNLYQAICFFYADNSLKYYFNKIKTMKGYENTIFIIVGDHRQEIFPSKSGIEIYHVPFMIYSPLLKKPHQFKSVSTHLNIAPTILNFLNKNYNVPAPKYVHWIGDVIDTASAFRNIHTLPFMKNNKSIVQLIDKGYFIYSNDLYKLKDGLYLEHVENPELFNKLHKKLENYKQINNYVITQKKICIICN